MIVNKCTYLYSLNKRNTSSSARTDDAVFLLRQYVKQMKQNYPIVLGGLKAIDNRFEENIYRSKLIRVESTGLYSPNTISTFRYPEGNPISGEFPVHHDRVPLGEFFDLDSIANEEFVIPYDEYRNAIINGTLDEHIHALLGYKLGNAFSLGGVYITDDGRYHENNIVEHIKPLALMIPSSTDIELAWRQFINVENVKKGTMLYQDLLVGVKLVSSNHAFILDGQAYFTIKLRRPLHHYIPHHEEVEHAD